MQLHLLGNFSSLCILYNKKRVNSAHAWFMFFILLICSILAGMDFMEMSLQRVKDIGGWAPRDMIMQERRCSLDTGISLCLLYFLVSESCKTYTSLACNVILFKTLLNKLWELFFGNNLQIYLYQLYLFVLES